MIFSNGKFDWDSRILINMVSLVASKTLMVISNLFLLICGTTLAAGGLMILLDPSRIMISRLLSTGPLTTLPYPLHHYLSLGLAALGASLATISLLGCWASCLHNYCLLTFYFLVILLILVIECAVYTVAWMWPQCLGLGVVEKDLIGLLQQNYGVAGFEYVTAALDLAQTTFNCCGISSPNEYDTSLWRLQALGPGLAVPLTCCLLENVGDSIAYLDPHPINTTLCEALEIKTQQGYRHAQSCFDPLEFHFRQQYTIFLGSGLIIVLIEFFALLATLYAFTKLYRYRQIVRTTRGNMALADKILRAEDDVTTTNHRGVPFGGYGGINNDVYKLTDSFRQNYKIVTCEDDVRINK